MQRVTITWTRYHTRFHLRYRMFSLRFAWFWAICKVLPRVSDHVFKKIISTHSFYKYDDNTLQIAPNHAKIRENIW